MGYNRYIYSDATLKAKAANNKAGLLKNKKRSDIVAYGTELVLSQIKYLNFSWDLISSPNLFSNFLIFLIKILAILIFFCYNWV